MLLQSLLHSFLLNLSLEKQKEIGIVRILIDILHELGLVCHGFNDIFVNRISWLLIRRFSVIRLLNVVDSTSQAVGAEDAMYNVI